MEAIVEALAAAIAAVADPDNPGWEEMQARLAEARELARKEAADGHH